MPLTSARRLFGSLGEKFAKRPRGSADAGSEDQGGNYTPADETAETSLVEAHDLQDEQAAGNREAPRRLDCRCMHPSLNVRSIDPDTVSHVIARLARKHEEWKQQHEARAVRISSSAIVVYSDEGSGEDTNLDVPLQIKHATSSPVVPSSLASEPCEGLGADGLLRHFNALLGTSYSVDIPGVRTVLQRCVERRYDFGTAFGRLRTFWLDDAIIPRGNYVSRWFHTPAVQFVDLMQLLDGRERRDRQARERALDRGKSVITDPHIRPRRVWDLYANRVVPMYAVQESSLEECGGIWTVSHSWVEDDQRHYVDTPVNGHEWLVPLPKDSSLDRIRVELLNLGVVYVWLDVLCLRQEDSRKPENEELRKKEWELDVPTIGSIYRKSAHVVTYLSGLGRPFEIEDTTNARHWINRAWTLQEGSMDTLIGGLTAYSPFPPNNDMHQPRDEHTRRVRQFYDKLCAELHAGQNTDLELFPALEIMLDRRATYEIDRVYGLVYILQQPRPGGLPLYLRGADDPAMHEQAWSDLVRRMHKHQRVQLAFLYPAPGCGKVAWRPSWSQLAVKEVPLAPLLASARLINTRDSAMEKDGALRLYALLLRNCTVRFLAGKDAEGYCRRGQLAVDSDGSVARGHVFAVEAHHQQPIPEDRRYVLVGPSQVYWWYEYRFWIVGVETAAGSVQKVTAVRMESRSDRDRLGELSCATWTEVTLI